MPPGVKFPGEEIVRAALALVREQGGYALCPRRHQSGRLRVCHAVHPFRKSIVPCILTHGVLNALSVFALEPDYKTQCIISLVLIVLAVSYSVYLLRRVPALTSGESCARMEKKTEGD